MKNIGTDADIEYFGKYVNNRNKEFESIRSTKSKTVGLFVLLGTLGMIFSVADLLNTAAFRIVFLALMVSGIICSAMSDKWFHGGRGFLFLNWLAITGAGVSFLIIGISLTYGRSPFLILVFVVLHGVTAILVLGFIMKRISSREVPKDNSASERNAGLGGGFGCFGGTYLSRIIGDDDILQMIMAAVCLAGAAVLWFGVERLFQLHYAVRYDIEVLSTGESQRYSFGLRKKHHCPLLRKTIDESLCTKINYENEGMLKQDKLRTVKKASNMTSGEIKQTCKRCRYCQLPEI